MKALLIATLVGFSALANADFVPRDDSRYAVLACQNDSILLQVLTMPNQKDLQLVIRDQRIDTMENVVYNAVVHPMAAQESHLYLNAQTSLRVSTDGATLKGYLNMRRDRPGIGMILDCRTYSRLQPMPRATY